MASARSSDERIVKRADGRSSAGGSSGSRRGRKAARVDDSPASARRSDSSRRCEANRITRPRRPSQEQLDQCSRWRGSRAVETARRGGGIFGSLNQAVASLARWRMPLEYVRSVRSAASVSSTRGDRPSPCGGVRHAWSSALRRREAPAGQVERTARARGRARSGARRTGRGRRARHMIQKVPADGMSSGEQRQQRRLPAPLDRGRAVTPARATQLLSCDRDDVARTSARRVSKRDRRRRRCPESGSRLDLRRRRRGVGGVRGGATGSVGSSCLDLLERRRTSARQAASRSRADDETQAGRAEESTAGMSGQRPEDGRVQAIEEVGGAE